jgi:hypothetical protein
MIIAGLLLAVAGWIPGVAHPPSDCMDSRDEEMRGATSEEQRSVLAFWQGVAPRPLAGGRSRQPGMAV